MHFQRFHMLPSALAARGGRRHAPDPTKSLNGDHRRVLLVCWGHPAPTTKNGFLRFWGCRSQTDRRTDGQTDRTSPRCKRCSKEQLVAPKCIKTIKVHGSAMFPLACVAFSGARRQKACSRPRQITQPRSSGWSIARLGVSGTDRRKSIFAILGVPRTDRRTAGLGARNLKERTQKGTQKEPISEHFFALLWSKSRSNGPRTRSRRGRSRAAVGPGPYGSRQLYDI